MVKDISRKRIVTAWVATVLVLFAVSIVAGAAITVGTAQLWLAACLVPPGILLLLWHGKEPMTIAHPIYEVDREAKGGRA
jgi:hypothetical protein